MHDDLSFRTGALLTDNALVLNGNDQSNDNRNGLQLILNLNPCSAHVFQLCVKKALRSDYVQMSFTAIRQTVKFFRRSYIGWEYLTKSQATDRISLLLLLIYMPNRWVSTMAMLQWYIKLQSAVEKAVVSLYKYKVKFNQLIPCPTLYTSQTEFIKGVLV